MKRYVTLIPAYKKSFDADEECCVARYFAVLDSEKIFTVPKGLDTSWYEKRYPDARFERFDDRFFRGIKGYNRLLLDTRFYERFAPYEYILIAQSDAVIWQEGDRIEEFIDRGFDYYGAPWIPERRIWEWLFPKKDSFPGFSVRCLKKPGCGITMGNGGFSLRKRDGCIKLIKQYGWRKIYWFIKRNEDIFFGVCGSDNRNDFKPADVETGREFALEYGLRECVKSGKIPYAVHGWKKEFADYGEMRRFLSENGIGI
ncbi:MAG: hypothetical protein K5686_13005 [Lachnospiraceae bacterium]|nr:hypothetical protein [Lachnospiraceae bacterium]